MLDFKRVLKSAKAPERGELIPLSTPWGESLDAGHVLPEHPRPTMQRDSYSVLNGWWDYAIVPQGPEWTDVLAPQDVSYSKLDELLSQAVCPSEFDGRILVPFSPETVLSGVGRVLRPDELLWYRRLVDLTQSAPGAHVLLHFEAVDWTCALFVNGAFVATHRGGYLPFDVDISEYVGVGDNTAELSLCVFDPTDTGVQPRGKQSLKPGGIWYTPQSGIWQSVWCEVVPAEYLEEISLQGDMGGHLHVEASAAGNCFESATLSVSLFDREGNEVLSQTLPVDGGRVDAVVELKSPHLWSPEDPYLYRAEVELRAEEKPAMADSLHSYCAFRSVQVKPDNAGVPRFCLNGQPYFLKGVLDQGFWSDSLMTAPADEALVHDIELCKKAGFNMLRKHIKVESARWYYHCDRLGMLVWQDAVQGGGEYSAWHTSQKPTLFSRTWSGLRDDTPSGRAKLSGADVRYQEEWRATVLEMIRQLKCHPCIVAWVLFNEGWGQFDARAATELVHAVDPTRPIDATSGWYDQGCGNFRSVHNYFRPLGVQKPYAGEDAGRAFVLSEFGGLTLGVPDHVSAKVVYGYGDFETAEVWRKAVQELLAQAGALEQKGCAGYVYTQVSDIEDEINGLTTYDRRIEKLLGC